MTVIILYKGPSRLSKVKKPLRGRPPGDARERILQAARQLIGQAGYDATSVPQIVEEAGVAQGTFYRYFKSKAGLSKALADIFNAQLMGKFDEAFQSQLPMFEMMPVIIGKLLKLFQGYRDIMPFLEEHAMPFGTSGHAAALRDEHYARMAVLIARDQKNGLIRNDIAPELLARIGGGVFMNLARMVTLEESELEPGEIFMSGKAFVMAALAPQEN